MHNRRHQRTPQKNYNFSNSRKSPNRLVLKIPNKKEYSFKGTNDKQLNYQNAHKLLDQAGKPFSKPSCVALLYIFPISKI